MEYAGYPITFRKIEDDVLIHCKNTVGLLSQVRAFIKKSNISGNYPFGVKTAVQAEISTNYDGRIGISCLIDTKEKFYALYEQCESFLKS